MGIIKPLLKWVGGKSQIIDDVLSLFPSEMNSYHEPFLGGGSVLLGLLSKAKEGAITVQGQVLASDMNSHLIHLYKNVQQQPDALIAELREFVDQFRACSNGPVNRKPQSLQEAMDSREAYYYWMRKQFNNLPEQERSSPRASAMMLFLNRTCFRGVYREGPNGFNVPYGNYKNPAILDEEHIAAVSALIKDVVFVTRPFAASLAEVAPNDFVYLDPPYAPETDTSFVSYTASGFDIESHKELFQMCHNLREQGTRLLMSNADVKLVRDAFPTDRYTTRVISCRRAINSKKPQSTTKEVLIMPISTSSQTL